MWTNECVLIYIIQRNIDFFKTDEELTCENVKQVLDYVNKDLKRNANDDSDATLKEKAQPILNNWKSIGYELLVRAYSSLAEAV
ncbi:5236_t:CDS:2 [Acaulospora colombiana]|uniref:5236_t:CDS:1 n=1 Tax=Acaulospora colombiana TaxID=27376 RepID=A0ACA9MHA6_9GLOM|nr:5236_t:CDS:2 [Acaulospora colombiana]